MTHRPTTVPRCTKLLWLILVIVAGCHHDTVLVDTPHAMLGDRGRLVYEALPDKLKITDLPVVYFTDRADTALDAVDPRAAPEYGSDRSQDISFGVARVKLTPEPSWKDLVEASTSEDRALNYRLEVGDVTRTGTIPSLEGRLRVEDGEVVYPPEASIAFESDLADFAATLEPFLTDDPNGNAALVFVHGFNNTFDDAVLRLAQTWHAAGRHGVPIVFTWPAGFDAVLAPVAYNRDRESGEFSVLQLKTLLMALAANDDIDRIHLVAHSRGTDVTTTALREIAAEIEAAQGRTFFSQRTREAKGRSVDYVEPDIDQGMRPSDVLKLETLVLVAPDLDVDIFIQRFISERVMRIAGRTVVYSSKKDEALGLARLFFASRDRLGDITMDDLDPTTRELVHQLPNMEFVECRVGGVSSHAYLFEHPAALSDMILVVRDGLTPSGMGVEGGHRPSNAVRRGLLPTERPLEVIKPGFYVLEEDYLKPVDTEESLAPTG